VGTTLTRLPTLRFSAIFAAYSAGSAVR